MKVFIYKKLIEVKGKDNLTYLDLLSTNEWKVKRDQIIKRDNYECKNCGKEEFKASIFEGYRDRTKAEKDVYLENQKKKYLETQSGRDILALFGKSLKILTPMVKKEDYVEKEPVILNVHHKYYIKNKLPWEYKQDALITVCSNCHSVIHETQDTLIYEDDKLENPKIIENCNKCGGTGYLGQYDYYMNGICFQCNGAGSMEIDTNDVKV